MPPLVDTAFTVRKPAWWDLTGQYDHDENPKSVEEAREWAGALWEPVRTPVFGTIESHPCESLTGCTQLAVAKVHFTHKTDGPKTSYACGRHANLARDKKYPVEPLPMKQLPDFQTVTRSDNNAVLNVANSTYQLFSNRETFELVEMMLDSTAVDGGVKFETGGVLKGGKLVWALARLDQPIEVVGANGARDASPIYPYLSVLNSHDGTAALRVINTSIRIVCWNTWSAAERDSEQSGRTYSFRHTESIRDRIHDAQKEVLGAQDSTHRWVEYANRMIAIPWEDRQVEQFLQDFIPMPPTPTERSAANVEEARNAVKRFYRSASCASIAGTAWGMIQATGEYLDHGRSFRTKDTYVSRTMLKPEVGKAKALKLIEEMVGA